MSRKQRTPEEIEAEMQAEDREDEVEEVDEEEADEEEQEEEGEDEESDDGDESPEDESDILHENYGAFLCMGYSPAQIDKHLPKLLAETKTARASYTKDMVGSIGEEMAKVVQDGYDEHFLPAFQEFMKELRQKYGADTAKISKAIDWMTNRMLTMTGKYHTAHLTASPWPKPENG